MFRVYEKFAIQSVKGTNCIRDNTFLKLTRLTMMFSRNTPKQPLIIWLSFISLLLQNLPHVTGDNLQGYIAQYPAISPSFACGSISKASEKVYSQEVYKILLVWKTGNFRYSVQQRHQVFFSFTVCRIGLCFVPFAFRFLTILVFKICSENLC